MAGLAIWDGGKLPPSLFDQVIYPRPKLRYNEPRRDDTMARPKIEEIAKMAGVSPSAVSIVINNRKGVSEKTRQRVLKIIEETNYKPNLNSRRLLFNRTDNIAVLFERSMSPLEHAFYSELNAVILQQCEANNYNMMFTSVRRDGAQLFLPDVISSRDVDGVIIYGDIADSVYNELGKLKIPFITIDNSMLNEKRLSVRPDYEEAVRSATNYLIDCGHEKIGYIGNENLVYFNSYAFRGFREAMSKAHLSVSFSMISTDAFDDASTNKCVKQIFSEPDKPTALMCISDLYAIPAIRALNEIGLDVPGDVSVIGVDDILLSKYIRPGLTTVRIDRVEMGKIAMSLLVKHIKGEKVESLIAGNNDIVIRESVRKI